MPRASKKKTQQKPGQKINKSAWIRSQSLESPAKDLVSKAKEAGIQISLAQVYTARSSAKKAGPARRGRPPASAAATATVRKNGVASNGGSSSNEFVQLVIRHGTANAQRMFDDALKTLNTLGAQA